MACSIKHTFHLSPDVKHHHSTGSMGIPACASRAILQVYQDEDSPQFSLLRFLHCSELLYYSHAILGHLDALSGPKRPAKLPGPNNKEKVQELDFLYPIHKPYNLHGALSKNLTAAPRPQDPVETKSEPLKALRSCWRLGGA